MFRAFRRTEYLFNERRSAYLTLKMLHSIGTLDQLLSAAVLSISAF